MSAKILPKYAADTRICTPFWPSSTSSLTLSPLSKEPLRLLVARVRLALRDLRQRRSVLLRWACLLLLVRPLADHGRRLVAQVELLQDVVDGENVTADALTLEALARRAVQLGLVHVAARHSLRRHDEVVVPLADVGQVRVRLDHRRLLAVARVDVRLKRLVQDLLPPARVVLPQDIPDEAALPVASDVDVRRSRSLATVRSGGGGRRCVQ